VGAAERGDRVLDAFELLERLLSGEQQQEVAAPVLVAHRGIAEAEVVHALHQAPRRRTERGPEGVRDRHVSVARRIHEAHQ
jgi:hypothetical protein